MNISFSSARTIGLTLLVCLIASTGFFFILVMERIAEQVNSNLELRSTQEKKLEKVKDLFDMVYRNYKEYLAGDIDDFKIVTNSVNRLIKESGLLKEMVTHEDSRNIDSLVRNAKRLKVIVVQYFDEATEDPASAHAIDAEIIMKEAELLLRLSIINLRKSIEGKQIDHNNAMLDEVRNGQRVAWVVIFGGIILGLFVAFFIGEALAGPVRRLVYGTQRLAEGDLTYRVKTQSNDEIGQLANAFNNMAEQLYKTTVSKSYVDNIIHFMGNGLIVAESNEKIKTVNQATIDLLGYSEDELIGKPMDFLFNSGQKSQSLDSVSMDMPNEVVFQRKDGSKIDITVTISEVKSKENPFYVGIFRDITEQKKGQDMIFKRKEELEETTKKLQEKTSRSNRFQNLLVGREHDMIKLKQEINELLQKLGQPKKFQSLEEFKKDREH